jgi:hypothetical protein
MLAGIVEIADPQLGPTRLWDLIAVLETVCWAAIPRVRVCLIIVPPNIFGYDWSPGVNTRS